MNRILSILLLLFAVLFSGNGQAREWSADNVPIPYLKDRTQYVSDPDHLLSYEARDSANLYLMKMEREMGVQTVFVVVDSVVNADAFRMAQDLGNHYGVGSKKERSGLVIVIAVSNRKYFIAPGKGVEEHLTDVDCADIGRECIVANMKEGNLDRAVYMTSKAICNKLKTGNTGFEQVDNPDEEFSLSDIILILCIFLPLIIFIFSRHDNHGGGGGGMFIPPFIFGGGGSMGNSGDSFGGGSFGGGSFGGGGAGGGW